MTWGEVMRNFRKFVFVVMMVFMYLDTTLPHALAQSQEEFTVERLKREMPASLRKIEARYAQIRGEFSRLDETNYDLLPDAAKRRFQKLPPAEQPHGVQLVERLEVAFATTGANRKCEVVSREQGTMAQQNRDAQSKQLYKRVDCVGPRGTFTLGWTSKSATPDLRDFRLEEGGAAAQYQTQVQAFLRAMTGFPFQSLADLLADPNFRITGVKQTLLQDHQCVRAEFSYQFVPPAIAPKPKKAAGSMMLVGSFTADPALGWALRSWEYATPGTDRSQAAEVNYQTDESKTVNPAVPAEIVTIDRKARTNRVTFQKIAFGPVPETEFTLSSYGLPEFDQPIGDVTASWQPLLIALAAVALLLLAAFLWYRSRQPHPTVR